MKTFQTPDELSYESPFNDEVIQNRLNDKENNSSNTFLSRNGIHFLSENSPFHTIEESEDESELSINSEGEMDSESYDNEMDFEMEDQEYIDFEQIETAAPPSNADLLIPGKTTYIRIDIGKANYPLNFTGVFVPEIFDPAKPVVVILYLHGMTHNFPGSEARMDKYWNSFKGNYDLRLREEINASGRNVVFVAPSLGKSPNANRNLLSGVAHGLDNYLEKVKVAVNQNILTNSSIKIIEFRSVILCAHSAGGQQMRMIALASNPIYGPRIIECWGFDSLYGGMSAWLQWAEKNNDKKLYIYYLGSTKKNALYLKSKAKSLPNIKIEQSSAKNHYMVPKEHLRQRVNEMLLVSDSENEIENFLDSNFSKLDSYEINDDEIQNEGYEFDIVEDLESSILNIFGEQGGGRITIKNDPATSDIAYIESFGKKIPIHRITKIAWENMVSHARKEGFKSPLLMPTSGYRSKARQQALWEQALKKHGSETEARKYVAKPGGSAHQSGRALDLYLGTKNNKESIPIQKKLNIHKWLTKNAVKYGFYPYEVEPWHWEYNPTPEQNTSDFSDFSKITTSSSSVQKAILMNEKFSNDLGWISKVNEINNLLLKATGQFGISLGPEAFVEAVTVWQKQQGFPEKDCDGVIGPNTWKLMKPFIVTDIKPEHNTPHPVMQSHSSANQNIQTQSLGKLTINITVPALTKSYPEYQFTQEDAEWLARFVEGEAGGKNNTDSHAVIWAMFNRFGMLRQRVKAWKNFSSFIRLYSTTLQPFLNSFGAAQRVLLNNTNSPDKFPIVKSNETYKKKDASGKMIDTGIPKVQYVKHIKLQQKPWKAFNDETRGMVTAILNGQIPNPGIGVATHFASTLVYLKTALKKKNIKREPSTEEWRNYTLQYARDQKWEWIGEKANLNQTKNAFFIQPELRNVPVDAVKVIPQNLVNHFAFEDELESVDREPEYEETMESEYFFEGESSLYESEGYESSEDTQAYG